MVIREVDGARFDDYPGFCANFSRDVLGGEHQWHGNLDALNDILRGGFGTPEGPWTLRLRNATRARAILGGELFDMIVALVRDHGPGGAEPEDEVLLELED
jgi:hypothetical protein